jgi:hypothetical protein
MMKRVIWVAAAGVTAFVVARELARLGARRVRDRRPHPELVDERLTEQLEESFPASDPPAHIATTGSLAH